MAKEWHSCVVSCSGMVRQCSVPNSLAKAMLRKGKQGLGTALQCGAMLGQCHEPKRSGLVKQRSAERGWAKVEHSQAKRSNGTVT